MLRTMNIINVGEMIYYRDRRRDGLRRIFENSDGKE